MATYLLDRESLRTQTDWERLLHNSCEKLGIKPDNTQGEFAYRLAFGVRKIMGIDTVIAIKWDSQWSAGPITEDRYNRAGDQVSLHFFFITPNAFYAGQGVIAENFTVGAADFNEYYKNLQGQSITDSLDGKTIEQRKSIIAEYNRQAEGWKKQALETKFNTLLEMLAD